MEDKESSDHECPVCLVDIGPAACKWHRYPCGHAVCCRCFDQMPLAARCSICRADHFFEYVADKHFAAWTAEPVRYTFFICKDREEQQRAHMALTKYVVGRGGKLTSRPTNFWEITAVFKEGQTRGIAIELQNEKEPGAIDCLAARYVLGTPDVSRAHLVRLRNACQARQPSSSLCAIQSTALSPSGIVRLNPGGVSPPE